MYCRNVFLWFLVPVKMAVMPTYCSRQPLDFSSFRRVAPCLPSAKLSWWSSSNSMVPLFQSSPSRSRSKISFSCCLYHPGVLDSIADSTFSSAPRRLRRSAPKIAKDSTLRSLPPRPFPSYSAKNMRTSHSSSMERRKFPPLPVTKPTASLGTSIKVKSPVSSLSPRTETGPFLCDMRKPAYLMARSTASAAPFASRIRLSRESVVTPLALPIFTFVLPYFPSTKAASSFDSSSFRLISFRLFSARS
mmetsp:Transcript_28178/g.71511  ORF Transcript_28178/g.71511 Transcript_28178/m.71511 type:complete len:247 (-) Transcript_28178:962-1702(-)